jgi:hypothetical protein
MTDRIFMDCGMGVMLLENVPNLQFPAVYNTNVTDVQIHEVQGSFSVITQLPTIIGDD